MSESRSTAQALKTEVDAFAGRLRASHALLRAARLGQVSRQTVATYLTNLRYLLRHTPIHLRTAIGTAHQLRRPDLAAYLERKLEQETGHDRWADADVAMMIRMFDVRVEDPTPQMEGIIGHLTGLVERAPSHYVAYILFAEQFTVTLGDDWVSALESSCGVPVEALSSVTKHV